jgi:hypothetical protein
MHCLNEVRLASTFVLSIGIINQTNIVEVIAGFTAIETLAVAVAGVVVT